LVLLCFLSSTPFPFSTFCPKVSMDCTLIMMVRLWITKLFWLVLLG